MDVCCLVVANSASSCGSAPNIELSVGQCLPTSLYMLTYLQSSVCSQRYCSVLLKDFVYLLCCFTKLISSVLALNLPRRGDY